ncbi:MAG: hypothetical protein UW64_C0008G0025 [Microgenomates group bacterium GW2011_GWC1_44_37]|nr:MAG: hypothetical protein UW42_C0004G0022 [Candidatus Collierbacteria bacterium GW2011_GWB1_44_197]KKT61839.1 MAG: hypothetical protein UW56_C0017G0022 [Candidatus Collierbacteria bacterium GW2011_GWD1_44_27]KKT68881.1 MAG: hypothetical protein UW64_C0008G0025 [Microgenomates group bacterium GW2011_GWC1_44_37]
MSTPMSLNKKTERMINISPEMAEVMISWPCFSLSGMPAEVVMIKTPKSMRTRASPPPKPTAILMTEVKNEVPPVSAEVEIQPIAVSTSSDPQDP